MNDGPAGAGHLFDLTGRHAVVIGGSRGMGRSMCLGLARAGADVMVVSRKLDACRALAEQIEAETGRRALAYQCNIGNWGEIDGLVETAYAEFGQIDVLVNNAGVAPLYDEISEISEALYDKFLNVNLKGPFRLSTLVGRRMQAAGSGSIIFVSSISAIRPTDDAIPYAAAKAGVNALTVGLAHLLGPDVRVNCIQPGAFLTDISTHWDMDVVGPRIQGYALQRAAQPDEVVGTVLYLASPASSYTTGAIIKVDGGHP